MDLIKVQDKDGLVRDKNSNAILNVDTQSYDQYVQTYKNKLSEKKRIDDMENKMIEIKSDIDEIKSLLRNLCNEP